MGKFRAKAEIWCLCLTQKQARSKAQKSIHTQHHSEGQTQLSRKMGSISPGNLCCPNWHGFYTALVMWRAAIQCCFILQSHGVWGAQITHPVYIQQQAPCQPLVIEAVRLSQASLSLEFVPANMPVHAKCETEM